MLKKPQNNVLEAMASIGYNTAWRVMQGYLSDEVLRLYRLMEETESEVEFRRLQGATRTINKLINSVEEANSTLKKRKLR